jgi:hypothetical protein
MKLIIGNKHFKVTADGRLRKLSQHIEVAAYRLNHSAKIIIFWNNNGMLRAFYSLTDEETVDLKCFYNALTESFIGAPKVITDEEKQLIIESIIDRKILMLL